MQNLELAQNKLKQYEQENILATLNSLKGKEQEELINQILKIDFQEICESLLCCSDFVSSGLLHGLVGYRKSRPDRR